MRAAFLSAVQELAGRDKRVWLLTGDLGYSVLEPFARAFPERFVNVGVAEQNMAGIAAGLALSGLRVFLYSIANFPTLRCLEQVRNDIGYHRLNVKIVSVGGGVGYGPAGYSHHAVEDLAVMRALHAMTIVVPADAAETRLAVPAIAEHEGPCYLRLGKTAPAGITGAELGFEIGKAVVVRDGKDLTFITIGPMLELALCAADTLATRGILAGVLRMSTVQPLDRSAVLAAAASTGHLITVEEHGPGGLGSAVAEVLATGGASAAFEAAHLQPSAFHLVGSPDYLRQQHGLSEGALVARALTMLGGRFVPGGRSSP